MPEDVKAAAQKIVDETKAGTYEVFTGPIKDQSGEVLTQLHPDQVREMIGDGRISGGMIPKTETALQAIDEGVRAVVILDGRVPHACLLELFTEHGAGSLIRSTEPRIKAHGLRQGEDGL